MDNSLPNEQGWFQSRLAEFSAGGSLTKLVNTDETDQLRLAVRVIEWVVQRIELKAAPAQLAELAATITSDTKVLRALTARQSAALR